MRMAHSEWTSSTASALNELAVTSFKALAVLEVHSECAILIPQRHYRPFLAEVPLHTHDLLIAARQVGDVSERDVVGYLLLQRQARLRHGRDVGELWIDLNVAYAEESLQASRGGRDRLAQDCIAASGHVVRGGRALARGQTAHTFGRSTYP